MKTIHILILAFFLFIWNCKQNPEPISTKKAESKIEVQTEKRLPFEIKELAKFSDCSISKMADVDRIFQFKEIDFNGNVSSIDIDQALDFYKRLNKGKQPGSLPIFEIRNTDTVILRVQGSGFGGAIWANVLVDKTTLQVKKIEFEHKSESDGYGEAITQRQFEDQFVGIKINLDADTFTLRNAKEQFKDGGNIIDGISGATMTSQGVVDMVNDGLKIYRNYLGPENGS